MIKKHLVFLFFYDNEKLTIHYKTGDAYIQKDLNIENRRVNNEYIFSKMYITSLTKRGYEIDSITSPTQNITYQSNINRYYFLKVNNSIKYVNFENFFIRNETDLNSIEVFTVKYFANNDSKIYRKSISKGDILIGNVVVTED
jgi:hypothetical protein